MTGFSFCSIIYYITFGYGIQDNRCWPRNETIPESNIWIFVDGLKTLSDSNTSNDYYHIGDNINFTCEYNYMENCNIFWTQTTGDVSIYFPHRNVRKYTISVTLDRFDNASIWCCSVYNNETGINIKGNLSFETKFKPDKDEIQKYYQNAVVSDDCNSDNGKQYIINQGKIIKLTHSNEDNNICISQIADPDHKIANYRRNVTYKTKPFLTHEELYGNFENSTQTTAPYDSNTTLEKTQDDIENPDKINDVVSIGWKAGLGAGILIPVIAIIVFTVIKSYRKRQKSAPEGLATANEVEYAEIMVNEGSANYVPTVSNAPYVQVIGVLLPQRQNKLAS